jgi:hypothetical protein
MQALAMLGSPAFCQLQHFTESQGLVGVWILTPSCVSTRAYRALEAAEDSKLGPVLVSLANPLKQVPEPSI